MVSSARSCLGCLVCRVRPRCPPLHPGCAGRGAGGGHHYVCRRLAEYTSAARAAGHSLLRPCRASRPTPTAQPHLSGCSHGFVSNLCRGQPADEQMSYRSLVPPPFPVSALRERVATDSHRFQHIHRCSLLWRADYRFARPYLRRPRRTRALNQHAVEALNAERTHIPSAKLQIFCLATPPPPSVRRSPLEGLGDIADDILDLFDADRQAHIAGRHAGRPLLGLRQLGMGRRGRVDSSVRTSPILAT